MESSKPVKSASSEFIWRRVHSLMGLWITLYLAEHLLVNSQAALWLGENGKGFIRMVNSLESLPYLHFVEALFIGLPLAIHAVWGIQRIFTSKSNLHSNGAKPSLPYHRNRAYTLQRWTSWILLFGILGHVAQMRFIEQPERKRVGEREEYWVKIRSDAALAPLAERLGVELRSTQNEETVAVAKDPGTAMLLMVRSTFQSLLWSVLYSIFVLAAAYHGCNGIWTFLITWGALLSYRSQRAFIPISVIATGVLCFLGFAAIWGSFYI
jgi:succinate dehydrogenase / fumarate reductase cytochrome b subunit